MALGPRVDPPRPREPLADARVLVKLEALDAGQRLVQRAVQAVLLITREAARAPPRQLLVEDAVLELESLDHLVGGTAAHGRDPALEFGGADRLGRRRARGLVEAVRELCCGQRPQQARALERPVATVELRARRSEQRQRGLLTQPFAPGSRRSPGPEAVGLAADHPGIYPCGLPRVPRESPQVVDQRTSPKPTIRCSSGSQSFSCRQRQTSRTPSDVTPGDCSAGIPAIASGSR
jgi:hypothetical protein